MTKLSALMAGVCLAGLLGAGPAVAQMVDVVRVTLSHGAMMGTIPLPPGEHTIRELTDIGSSASVIQIRSSAGASAAAMAMRIPEPNNRRTGHTQVVLQRDGDKYHIDKIWLEGREYGYELLSAMGRE
jgi:hypothetical protein